MFFSLFFFLYDDIGRGQLNMQLNKSDDGGDNDGGGEGEEEDRGRVTDYRAFCRCSDGLRYFLIFERLFGWQATDWPITKG